MFSPKKISINRTSAALILSGLNLFLLLILVAVMLFREAGFSWKRWLRYEVSLLPYSPLGLPVKNLSQDEVLRFAVINDSHIGARYSSNELLRNALKKAKEREAEFVVLIGDISDSGKLDELQEAKKLLEESGLKYFTVPGNHDTWQGGIGNYEKTFGKRYQRIEIWLENPQRPKSSFKKVVLYLVDSTGSGGLRDRLVDPMEMSWLESFMNKKARNDEELIFVFQESFLARFSTTERNYLAMFYCKQKIDGLFYANSHLHERYYHPCYYLEESEGQNAYVSIPMFGAGALVSRTEFRAFLLAHYFNDGKFEVERVLLDEQLE